MSRDIAADRETAAKLSGGTSNNVIYSMIERVILARDLKGQVLDYGAGIGELSRRLLEMGRFASVSAVDIMRPPADLGAVHWIQQDLNEPIQGHTGEFDVVIAAEVVEHLENPRFTLREIFKLLRPGGTALVSTPNNESWRSIVALLVRGHYVAFGDSCYPAHITALLRKDLIRIFREAEFHTPVFHFTGHGSLPGTSLTWQAISFGMLQGLRFSDNILAAATKPAIQ